MKNCEVCGNATFREERSDEVFNLEGRRVLVEGIPALVCCRCGEATFSRDTAEKVRVMLHGNSRPSRQISVDVFAYV